MTKRGWLAGKSPERMLAFLREQDGVSVRQLRLFACACLRRLEDQFRFFPDRVRALHVAERFADGEATGVELSEARSAVELHDDNTCWACYYVSAPDPWEGAVKGMGEVSGWHFSAVEASILAGGPESKSLFGTPKAAKAKELAVQAVLLRDVIGDPFHPVPFAPAWLTPNAVGLADAIYTARAWDRMPVLADALEEAGCTDARVLDHCRGPGPHARGCWVVDAILGKS